MSCNQSNRRFTKAESKAAFARLKGLGRKGVASNNSSYSYNANPENCPKTKN